jgi:S1-C subfamily serine protease
VTNAHVTASCDELTLFGVSTSSQQVHFTKVIKDQDRDLALLIPSTTINGGLSLAPTDSVVPGTQVSTWGYPFYYNGISPLLSVGYVSGFRTVSSNSKSVKHVVINGAFNHGNSGGALLAARRTDVLGIVVATYHFYPPEVKRIIDSLAAQGYGIMFGEMRKPDGTVQQVSEAQVTSIVLNEFYEKTQVMISEAIAVSELRNMINEHALELPKQKVAAKRTH